MPGETPEVYYRLVLFIPFLDDLLEQLESRISTMSTTSLINMKLLPGKNLSDGDVVHLEEVFGDDMPSRGPPHAYVWMWSRKWECRGLQIFWTRLQQPPAYVRYPNIYRVMWATHW